MSQTPQDAPIPSSLPATPAASAGPAPGVAAGSHRAESDDDRRSRLCMEQLLARPAVRSQGGVTLADGRRLEYDVVASFVPVRLESSTTSAGMSDEPQAAVFTTAYLVRQPAGAPPRPVCFAFNGGPGSSSLWLHFGALGPRRAPVLDSGYKPPPPYTLVENPLTWLQHFDLIFIDPPHTGWSVAASQAARDKLFSVDGDVEALVEVMRVWLARHQRFASPLFLVGESYGTTRAAAMAEKLLDLGLALSGLILVSCAMDIQALEFNDVNLLPYALFLPGFAVAAQYHGLLQGSLAQSPEAARLAAEDYAQGDYLKVLQAGSRLGDAERRRAEKRLAQLTGLPVEVVAAQNLRIRDVDYFYEALRPRGQILGRLDARVAGPLAAQRRRDWQFDPSIEALCPPYITAALAYYQALGCHTECRFVAMSSSAHESWNWSRGKSRGNSYTCTSPDLARALRRDEHLRLFVASGRYDLGTPYSATDWSLAQLDLPTALHARITHRYYDAGHMMYTRQTDLVQLAADLAQWLGTGQNGQHSQA